jgi:hypothetical protein
MDEEADKTGEEDDDEETDDCDENGNEGVEGEARARGGERKIGEVVRTGFASFDKSKVTGGESGEADAGKSTAESEGAIAATDFEAEDGFFLGSSLILSLLSFFPADAASRMSVSSKSPFFHDSNLCLQ